ncbi:LLM class flavin-dependent oxidoreductase [Chloroflexi bacterium TSY]|nr:LLM class flavin-dependent oxidoreductase [Chloroflexi bacterium TSY]
MNYGIVIGGGHPQRVIEIAQMAEEAGWDGFFLPEGLYGIDPWVLFGGIAVKTERICIGTLLTPPSRRRPWKLASEALALNLLSDGRAILSLGLGALDTGFEMFGEETDRKTRAELMDEAIDIMDQLWTRRTISHGGKHYQVEGELFFAIPAPKQQPRIPIWVTGAWPRMKSMRRVLRCDGILASKMPASGKSEPLTPDDVREIRAYVNENRTLSSPFDIIVEDVSPGDDPVAAAEKVRPWMEAGATWWIESPWDAPDEEAVVRRIQQGPPTY